MTLAISAVERVRWRASEMRRDRIAHQLFASDQQRQLFRLVTESEVLFRAANKASKTWAGADLALCLMQGVKEVDGRTIREAREGAEKWLLPVPPIKTPCVGWCVVPGYKQSVDSVIEALRERIGTWDHHWVSSGGPMGFGALYVRPRNSTSASWKDWSRLVFMVDDGKAPTGGTIDFAWADEPPSADMWREVRNRRRSRHPFYKFITATPLKKFGPTGWAWLRESFESGHEGRIQIISSVYDNQALSPEDIHAQEIEAQDDPHRKARLYGEWVDTSGDCPYREEYLDRWENRCRLPTRVEPISIIEAALDGERDILAVTGDLQVWHEPETHHTYRIVVDPAGGIEDEKREHDPCCFHVVDETTAKLVARHNSYLEPYAIGVMADIVGRRYLNARVDVEMNKYGDTVVLALRKRFYPQIGTTSIIANPGEIREQYGFTATEINRAQGIGAIQRALAEDSFICESQDVIDCLKNVVNDKNGKPVAGPHCKDEDQTCLGWALRQMALTPAPSLPTPHIVTPEEIMEREMGIMRRARFQPPSRQRWR